MRALITGGARSGKSSFAERYAAHLGSAGLYVATAQTYDAEMERRARQHRERREASGFAWTTAEEPYALVELLRRESGGGRVVLVDCLTLWLTNRMLQLEEPAAGGETDAAAEPGDEPSAAVSDDRSAALDAAVRELAETVADYRGTLLLVTNEVGSGIVPAYPLGRRFRDEAGSMNQRLAAVCDQVFLVTAGIPLELKSKAFRFD